MRERKLKIWDKENNVMISMCNIPFEINCNMQEFLEIIICGYSDRYIPLDYTGLEDKNGIEIYEGNILGVPNPAIKYVVKFGEYHYNPDYDTHENGVGFYMETIGSKEEKRGLENATYIKVIGNIYENPEILKEVTKWKRD